MQYGNATLFTGWVLQFVDFFNEMVVHLVTLALGDRRFVDAIFGRARNTSGMLLTMD